MAFLKYTGDYDEVEVPDLRLVVKRNQTIEVPADAAEGLLCQDSWKKTTATKSAAEAEPVETDPDLQRDAQ